jgi:hypothetical protein
MIFGYVRYRTDIPETLDFESQLGVEGWVMSVPVTSLLSEAAFDPEVIDIMASARAKTCKMLHDKGQPAVVQEVIARKIIAIARTGERNPDQLCERALSPRRIAAALSGYFIPLPSSRSLCDLTVW